MPRRKRFSFKKFIWTEMWRSTCKFAAPMDGTVQIIHHLSSECARWYFFRLQNQISVFFFTVNIPKFRNLKYHEIHSQFCNVPPAFEKSGTTSFFPDYKFSRNHSDCEKLSNDVIRTKDESDTFLHMQNPTDTRISYCMPVLIRIRVLLTDHIRWIVMLEFPCDSL